ncbi:MAG TPA: ribonuclease III domain-containing protein [Candidatus Izemoplasmatales bacterium]|nr:ribonuclease III domain-containing protein [Candidatus Izemoplasmatales bacterium]
MIQHNGLTLAYLGDAIYELKIRSYLLNQGLRKVNDLHQSAIQYTQSNAQALCALKMVDNFYTDKEVTVFKRGRNQSASHKPKNTDIQTYNQSTGFEAVIGYLYLKKNKKRLEEIMDKAIEIVNASVGNQ